MTRSLIAYALVTTAAAAAAFVSTPSLADGLSEYQNQFVPVTAQRSRAEVQAEAYQAARDGTVSVDAKSRVLPEVKSALSRDEVRQAAFAAARGERALSSY
ncbi:DUF4148 domain-containing protein [Curvibacter sp. HBC61]|uniref:DUF4148 domain-containing protein n=1 Tax=Curvibacter cyanobacteriorum TaxID=3026422 RepID=A0ABT5MUM4_9BURK|nr:DUF4148 domain-containing protein [Curvibacter sp. HBC61]MDD0837605.1 DUF4148 domain-containing protein [Curvibacter sp. HBC61]